MDRAPVPRRTGDDAVALARATGAVGVLASAGAGLTAAAAHLVGSALAPGARVDHLVALGVVGVGVLAALALLPGCLLLWWSTAARLVGRPVGAAERLATRLTPALLRRAVAAGLGAALGLGVVAPATADEVDLGWEPTRVGTSAGTVGVGTPIPAASDPRTSTTSNPTSPASTAVTPSSITVDTWAPDEASARVALPSGGGRGSGAPTPAAPESAAPVVVAPGDTLWAIAAAHLDEPTPAAVARAWPAWFAANRDVIDDPDLIHPGQQLRPPDPTTTQELS